MPNLLDINSKEGLALQECRLEAIQWLAKFVNNRDGITPERFAQKAFIKRETMSKIMRHKQDAVDQTFKRIAYGVGIWWDEIMKIYLRSYQYEETLSEATNYRIAEEKLVHEFVYHFMTDAKITLKLKAQGILEEVAKGYHDSYTFSKRYNKQKF